MFHITIKLGRNLGESVWNLFPAFLRVANTKFWRDMFWEMMLEGAVFRGADGTSTTRTGEKLCCFSALNVEPCGISTFLQVFLQDLELGNPSIKTSVHDANIFGMVGIPGRSHYANIPLTTSEEIWQITWRI